MSSDGQWSRTTLGIACEINPSKPRLADLPDSTPILFVPMAAVDESQGEITAPHQRQLRDVRKKSLTTFAPGDVLFAKITPCMENGKSAIVPEIPSGLGFGSTEFHVLRPSKGVDARFVWYVVRQDSFRRTAEQQMTGSVGQARVPASFLRDFPLHLPPPEDQSKIVKTLDALSVLRRSASGHFDAASTSIDRLRQSIYAAASSGMLTAAWRLEHPQQPLRVGPALSAAGSRHASPGNNTSDLLDVPETWGWWTIESICSEVIDYRGRTPPHQSSGPIPLIRTTQIALGRINWEADRFVSRAVYDQYMTRGLPRLGDILLTMEAPLGDVGIVDRRGPFAIAQRILLLRPGARALGEYLAIALQSLAMRHAIDNRATGTGVRGIAYKRLRSVEVPIPPLAEQHEIIRRVNALINLADSIKTRVESTSHAAQIYAQSLLSKAFVGEA